MKTNKKIIWLAAVGLLFGAAWIFFTKHTRPTAGTIAANGSVTQLSAGGTLPAGDKQVIEILAKEGYQPPEIAAKAGVPVILKMKTNNSFDCSTTFSLPQFNFRTRLQPTGEVALEIPAQKAGDSVYGVCGMGMYHFVIKFT